MDLHKRESTGLPSVIAEIGFNHEGSLETAESMIRAAAEAGADAVKFQTFRAADLALPDAAHFEAVRCAEMRREDAHALASVAKQCGIAFFSTPFSVEAVSILEEVGVPAYKIASMDVTTPYLLDAVAATSKPVILSTGMSTLKEIGAAVERLHQKGAGDVGLLHCLSLYPARAEDCNLSAIRELKQAFGLPTGWSDHYPGTKACLAAFCAGAEIIETHFTLDTATPGGDHNHSADPPGLHRLISDMRLFNLMQGKKDFYSNRPDRQYAPVYRRGVYAARDLVAGTRLRREDLLFCRPESAITPRTLDDILGRILARTVPMYKAMDPSDLSQK